MPPHYQSISQFNHGLSPVSQKREGDFDQAEPLFRQGLHLAGEDDYTRAGAVERLIPLLDKTGRTEEAEALIDPKLPGTLNGKNGWAMSWIVK